MRAAIVDPSSDSILISEVETPRPAAGQLLVRVRAAGLNRADLTTREGSHRKAVTVVDSTEARQIADTASAPFIGGNELAGEVVELGGGVTSWAIGARVMAQGPGFAEFALVDEALAIPAPVDLSWEEAGALPATFQTVNEALVMGGALTVGDVVLVHAASSGVGMTAVALAGHLGAGTIFGTSQSAAKLATMKRHFSDLPCDFIALDSSKRDIAEVVVEQTDGHGADVIIDPLGAAVFSVNFRCAAFGGRIVHIGRLTGRHAQIDLADLSRKRIRLVGSSWSTRTREDKMAVVERCRAYSSTDLAAIRPRIHAVFSLDEIADAERELAENSHVGKIVVVP